MGLEEDWVISGTGVWVCDLRRTLEGMGEHSALVLLPRGFQGSLPLHPTP